MTFLWAKPADGHLYHLVQHASGGRTIRGPRCGATATAWQAFREGVRDKNGHPLPAPKPTCGICRDSAKDRIRARDPRVTEPGAQGELLTGASVGSGPA